MKREHTVPALILLLAFAVRVATRLIGGEADFLTNGYLLFLRIASSFLDGQGLCMAPEALCALRMPLYPLVVAPWLAVGWLYPGLVLLQAGIGGALTWLAWKLGRALFDERTGVVAALLTAINPYTVVHDTAIQETVLINFLMALLIYLLVEAYRRRSAILWLIGGLVLALAVLTTARIALIVPCTLLWTLLFSGPAWRARIRNSTLLFLPVLLLVGGWVARNWRLVGAPVLTTESGASLWVANNGWLMAYFPRESTDRSQEHSYRNMTPAQSAEFEALHRNEVAQDRLLGLWARQYIAAHPLQTLRNSAYKVWVAASGQLTPARGPVLQTGYALLFIPIHLLAAFGLWRSRKSWKMHAPVYTLLLAFAVTTAIFWAHTSHKSYIDVFLFVYAAAVAGPALLPYAFTAAETRSSIPGESSG